MSEANFGPMLVASDVEDAVIDTIQLYLPDYLAELCERREWGAPNTDQGPPLPRSWRVWPDATGERWPEDQLPCVLVTSTGTTESPWKEGDGSYGAYWLVGVGVIVSARDERSTSELAKVYAAAVRKLLLDHGSLRGKAQGVDWLHESYDDRPADAEDNRSFAIGMGAYTVQMEGVVNDQLSPPDWPPGDPPPDPDNPPVIDERWPKTIEEIDIEVDNEEIA